MPDTYFLVEKIKKKFDRLSNNDRKIATFVLNHQSVASLETLEELAKKIEVSKSAIVRFATHIDYKNFKSLQKELREHIYYKKMESPLDLLSKTRKIEDHRSKNDVLEKQFRKNAENIQRTSENIRPEEFNKVVDRLSNKTGKIFIMGQRKSYSLAIYFYSLLNPILDHVYLLESRESFLTDNLLSVSRQDLLIVFSFKRYALISAKVAQYFASLGSSVVLITDSHIAPASKWANYTFICASEGIYIFDTVVSAISLIEGMISALVTRKEKAIRVRLKTSEGLLKEFQILQK